MHSYEFSTKRRVEYHTIECNPKINNYKQKWFIGHTGDYKGFVNWLVELFDELRIPYQPFRSSIIIELGGETYTLFQHKKNINWFYFSDKFKAKNFKRFFLRIKSFIIKYVGKEVEKVFKKFEEMMFNELEELVKYSKNKFKDAKSKIRIEKDEVMFNFFGIFKFIFKTYNNQVAISVSKELFRIENVKKKIKKVVFTIMQSLLIFFNPGHKNKIIIRFREMPQWVIV